MKKEEGAAGSVLGGGSFLRQEGMPGLGERNKRKGVWLITSLNVEVMELLVGETPGGVYLLLMLAQLLGKKSTPEKRYRCYDLEFCV